MCMSEFLVCQKKNLHRSLEIMATNSSESSNNSNIASDKKDNQCGDINQNFLNQRIGANLQHQHFQQQLRGINSMKASPDSGWTFPNITNCQMLQHTINSQQQVTSNIINNDGSKRTMDLHLPLINHHDNNGYHSGIFQDAYQTKLISPLLEMSLRQQHMQHHQLQKIHKQRSQAFGNVLTPQNGRGIHPVKTPVSTPLSDSKTPDQALPPFANFSSSIPIVGSPQFQAAIAAAQMKTYYSFLQQSNMRFPMGTTPSPNNENNIVFGSNSITEHKNLVKNSQSYTSTVDNIKIPSVTSLKEAKTEAVATKPSRPTLLGHLKSMDAARNKTSGQAYGYETRSYQSTVSTSSTTSQQSPTNTVPSYASPSVEKRDEKLSNPVRPNHFGPNFVAQTQLLSVNVTHASDRGSSDSPGRNTSFSVASLQSSSPAGSEKKVGSRDTNNNVCPQCGKQFSSSSALAKHKLTHSDERKFVCTICSRGFKRQDHLNGHMITHRDKKPHECHFQDCGKSYCDMRSLRRHLENHHSSPPGGTTPASYMPKLMLYPGYNEEKAQRGGGEQPPTASDNRLDEEPPRPSSAPLVPPEPKRITRTRRSSSGEETHMQLDPSMLRELEHLKKNSPYSRREREASDDYIKPRDERIPSKAGLPTHLSAASTHLLKPYDHSSIKHSSAYEHDARIEERHRQHLQEYEKHLATVRDAPKPPVGDRHKEYDGKHDYGATGSYPPGLTPRISSAYPWAPHQNAPPRHSSASNTMPYLLNIRNPFSLSPHGAYASPSGESASSDISKLSKSELEARHQAVNTYFQMWANGQHSNLTPEQLFMYPHGRMGGTHRANLPPTPTDPISIAVAAAKEPNDRHSYSVRDGLYGIHPTTAKWQPVMQDDSVTLEKDNKPNFYHQPPPAASSHESYTKRPPVTQERNIIDEPFKPSESNHKYSTNNNRYYDNRATTHLDIKSRDYGIARDDRLPEQSRSPQRFETPTRESHPRFEHLPHIRVDTPEGLTSSALSPNKKRPRPGPIIIPPAVNNRTMASSISPSKSFPGFPRGIYTPPAMLSPRSIFFNPPGFGPRVSLPPHTPQRMHLTKRRSSSIDQRETTPQTTVPVTEEPVTNNNNNNTGKVPESPEVPEPKINIGQEFQAVLPHVLNRTEAQKDIHRASLMWSPLKEDQQKHDEVEAYLDMACSLVLYGGSNNKEYALHILQRTRGNVKEAVRLLLSRRHILRADDPNADYHYSGSVRWTAKERLAFRQAYRTKGKVFIDIQKEVGTKNVQQCVEFYYLWKAMHPESFRARTRMVEIESEQDDEEVPPTPTAPVAPLSTLREPVFECDHPDCRARFVSRQALNGHIRVHGGSFSKPIETRRPKGKPDMPYNPIEGMPSPPKKKKTTQPDAVIMSSTGEGPMPQFQCKVCGRVFSKVKSRSAHMKTHVKRDENNKPIKTPKPSKKSQHQHPQQPPQPPNQPSQPHPPSLNPMTVFAHA